MAIRSADKMTHALNLSSSRLSHMGLISMVFFLIRFARSLPSDIVILCFRRSCSQGAAFLRLVEEDVSL